MRFDTAGLFWDDTPAPRVLKPQAPPRTPPPRTWEEPGYLPYLEEARRLPIDRFTWQELEAAQIAREPLLYDCEIFPNYTLFAFASVVSGKVIYFEMFEGVERAAIDLARLGWIFENFTTITFAGNYFDLPMASLALAGFSCSEIKAASNRIISGDGEGPVKPWMVLKALKVKQIKVDTIDLIEVAPLSASLKIYGGRLHTPRMQELPFQHMTILSPDQIAVVRWYCIGSDLTATGFLFMDLKPQIELRQQMSQTYGIDLRSKSDSQVAEAVVVHELIRHNNGLRPQRVEIPPGSTFQYRVPDYVNFEAPELNAALEIVRNAHFSIAESGAPELPESMRELKVRVGDNLYQMGIGGLHSCETNIGFYADDEYLLIDRDVVSYYPSIILNQGLYPSHLGPAFLEVYKTLVDRRKQAKKDKNKVEADSLKISVNGIFGKTGSKWSVVYAPDLMVQVTMSGQLSLLMLIERLHCFGVGVQICSANTDGVLIRCHKSKREMMLAIIKQWELETGFETEETSYQAVFARDVNNYIAVKMGGGTKVKGTYSERGSAGDSVLSKNPENLICGDALAAFLTVGTPIAETIRSCKDVRRFVTVRQVTGGAVKDGEYLGKAIRWYQSNAVAGEIIYAKTGNKVPNSECCRPCMELPKELPSDVDFDRYERETLEMLREIGYPMPELVN